MTTRTVMVGVVEDLTDPDALGRVRVRYATLGQLSNWARIATPMAGADRGLRFKPELGDEVLVAHENGDVRRPYVLGGLWSSTDKPPADDGDAKANNWRFLVSRSGHILKFDDTAGAEKIELTDQSGALHVVLDSAAGKILVTADKGDIEAKASGNVKVEAATIDVKATGDITIDATGTLTLKGATVLIN